MLHNHDRIVVTGGAGFIGSHLVERLLDESSARVVVVDNFSRGRWENLAACQDHPRLEVIDGDVGDKAIVAAAVRGASVVYHLAARVHAGSSVDSAGEIFGTNVIGTHNVLSAAAELAVQRLVFVSSRQVYGEPISLPVDEDHPLLTVSCYGASKVAAEAQCRAFRRAFGLPSVILRLANVYGPRDFDRVVPIWIERAALGQDLPIYGGKQVADFLWIGLAIDALIGALHVDGPLPPINIASGTGSKLIDVARRIVRLAGGQVEARLLPARPGDVHRFIANVAPPNPNGIPPLAPPLVE